MMGYIKMSQEQDEVIFQTHISLGLRTRNLDVSILKIKTQTCEGR